MQNQLLFQNWDLKFLLLPMITHNPGMKHDYFMECVRSNQEINRRISVVGSGRKPKLLFSHAKF